MKCMRYWLASKKLQMAQLHDLSRQLQEAWAECDTLGDHLVDSWDREECLRDQLHRVARERDQERKKRIDAEGASAKLITELSGAQLAKEYWLDEWARERKLRLEAEDRLLTCYLDNEEG